MNMEHDEDDDPETTKQEQIEEFKELLSDIGDEIGLDELEPMQIGRVLLNLLKLEHVSRNGHGHSATA